MVVLHLTVRVIRLELDPLPLGIRVDKVAQNAMPEADWLVVLINQVEVKSQIVPLQTQLFFTLAKDGQVVPWHLPR